MRRVPSRLHAMYRKLSPHQVNNAYEVLIDHDKRQSYDRHGTWPPPTEDPPRHPQHNTRSHPFHANFFTFTDPFELFNSFFGHANPLHDPFTFGPPAPFPDPFFAPAPPFPPAPFGPPGLFNSSAGMDGGHFHDVFHDPFVMHPPVMGGPLFQSQGIGSGGRSVPYFSSTSSFSNRHGAGGGQWVSESRSTSTVNGLTTSVHECVDSSVRPSPRYHIATNPWFPRVTNTQQLPTQTDAGRMRSMGSFKPRGRLMLRCRLPVWCLF